MKMIYTVAGMLILAASAADARVSYDPLRCEALKLQRESRLQQCMSNCEKKVLNRDGFDGAACDDTCRVRYDRAVSRLDRRPACRPPAADPHQCEARALKVESRHLICQASCERKGRRAEFDLEECHASCDSWCDAAIAEVLSGTICGDGRAGDGAAEDEQPPTE